MWVFEEYVKLEDGKWIRPARGAQPPEGKTWVDEGYEPLTEVINRLNENVIYLPGIKLPKSIVAQPDIKKCVTGATMMVFVIPHNFLAPIVPKMEARPATAHHTPHRRHRHRHRHRPRPVDHRPEKRGPNSSRNPNPGRNPNPNPNLNSTRALTLCRAPSPRALWASRSSRASSSRTRSRS